MEFMIKVKNILIGIKKYFVITWHLRMVTLLCTLKFKNKESRVYVEIIFPELFKVKYLKYMHSLNLDEPSSITGLPALFGLIIYGQLKRALISIAI